MSRAACVFPALLLGGCYLAHGAGDAPVIDAGAVASDAGRIDAGRPDAGPPPPELVCEDDRDHGAEAARMADAVARAGFGADADPDAPARTGRIVEVADDRLVVESDDGARETFVAEGQRLTEHFEPMTPAEWGMQGGGWHFVRDRDRDTWLWVRAFDGEVPEPFWQRSTELRFAPACAEVDRCGDEVHQYALLVDRGWPPLHAAHAGERLDIETGTYLFLVAHVGSADAALECGGPAPFRAVVTVISREPCVC